MKYLTKIYRFMYGRHGIDDLYNFLIRIYFILLIINLFVKNKILSYVILLLAFIIIFRIFSRNTSKRRKENKIYLKYKNKVSNFFKDKTKYIKDKDHVYKKCKKCKTILKLPLPYEKGFKKSKCPTCGNTIKFLVLRKQKIEVIKPKRGKK